jgi:hypothetical protein
MARFGPDSTRRPIGMSGHGGHKHRKRRLTAKRSRTKKLARQNVVRVRAGFEAKHQEWDPKSNAIQAGALNHAARRLVFGTVPKKD